MVVPRVQVNIRISKDTSGKLSFSSIFHLSERGIGTAQASTMGFGISAADVADFAARSFVRASLAQPNSPTSVLSFFLGIDFKSPLAAEAEAELKSGAFLVQMTPLWFSGNEDYDALCQKSFSSLVREAGTKQLKGEWESTVNGKLAQLILCDQLSRNAFRGTDEAFAYDETSLEVAKLLTSEFIFPTSASPSLEGTFYPAYSSFLATAFMHSEDVADHELGLNVIDWAVTETPPNMKDDWWDNQAAFLRQHKAVLDRFGRFPHRNSKKGRQNTKEEDEWLADVDALPSWAKSQG